MMKTTALLALIFCGFTTFAFAERQELGWISRDSVEKILGQFHYGYLKVISGYKEAADDPKDGPGWNIFVRCEHKETKAEYNARLWVSDDWKKGSVISVEKR